MPAVMDYSKSSPFNAREGAFLARNYDDPNRLAIGQATMERRDVLVSTTPVATGTLNLTFLTASKSEAVSQIRIGTGSTAAAATPTLCRLGLYKEEANKDLTLVASIPNDTTLFATTGNFSRAFSLPFNVEAGVRYAIGLLVVTAFAAPTFKGNNLVTTAEAFEDPKISAVLITQTDLPSSIPVGSLAATSNSIYSVVLP